MKKLVLMVMAAVLLVSCGAGKNLAQKPVKTHTLPGQELLKEPDAIRAWAVGVSTSEMTAKKKAMTSAASQLAQMLNSTVKTAIDSYSVALEGQDAAKSMDYVSKKITTVSDQVISGARIIFDKWGPKTEEGMFQNYIVLELTAEDFFKKFAESIADAELSGEKVDEQLLKDAFSKAVNAGK